MCILIMNDVTVPTLGRILTNMLDSLKLKSILVSNCEDAWEVMLHNTISNILIDINVVCSCKSNFKKLDKNINIIIFGNIGLSCHGCYDGFDKILTKPFTIDDLKKVLDIS